MADRIIVLTGGIGSGKSEASKAFEALGVTVVDADAISHELTARDGAAIEPIRNALGEAAIDRDGALHRAKIREMVFADPTVRHTLESILHPMIANRARQRLRQASGPYVVYAVPLWVEKYGHRHPQQGPRPDPGIEPEAIVVVDCDDKTRMERVAQRSGLSVAQIMAIMATQASRQERLAAADIVLENTAGLESLAHQVASLHQRLIRP